MARVPKHLESFESRSEVEAFRNFDVSAFRLNAYFDGWGGILIEQVIKYW